MFDGAVAVGTNTEYSGFVAAYRANFGTTGPGRVAMAGCGGVGKAIGFALANLGTAGLHLFDADLSKADKLARAIAAAHPAVETQIARTIEQACESADGLVNCTPLGLVGHPGSAFPDAVLKSRRWAFDAVYTPIDTPFLLAARAAGLAVMTGYELLLHQAADCFRIFTGHSVDAQALRRTRAQSDATAPQGA